LREKKLTTSKEVTRRDYLKTVGVGVAGLVVGAAAGYLAKPTEVITGPGGVTTTVTETVTTGAPAAKKPEFINVLTEDFEPLSSFVASKFKQRYGVDVRLTVTEFTPCHEKEVADMVSGAATSLYDVACWADPFTRTFARRGYYEPLDDYIAKSEVIRLDNMQGPWMGPAKYQGKIWGLPFHCLDMQLTYRKDLLAKAGYDRPPATYQEILEYAKKLHDPAAGVYGYTGDWYDDNFWYNFRRRIFAAGGRMFNPDGSPAFNSDAGERALQWFKDMWQAGVVFPETLRTYSGGVNNKVTAAGKAALSFCWSWANMTFEDPKLSVIQGKYGFALNPYDEDDPDKKKSCAAPVSEGVGGAITAKSQNKEWAFKFIEEYLTYESQLYNVTNLGLTPVRRDVFSDPETKKWPIFDLDRQQLDNYPTDSYPEPHSLSPVGVDFEIIRWNSEYFHKAILGNISVKEALSTVEQLVIDAQKKA